MIRVISVWLALTPLLALAGSSTAIDSLKRQTPELMKKGGVPGLAVAAVLDGRLAWTGAFGVTHAETKRPVAEDTVFEAASLSKPVFAYLCMKLADRGQLDLDKPLAEILDYPRLAHEPRYRRITPRMALSHQTGLPNWGGDKLELQFDPGQRFSYSGEGYVLLQRTVEKITGQGLDALARREVFDPLGMKHSHFGWRDDYEKLAATGHNPGGAPQTKNRPDANAAATLHTTAADYGRFLAAFLSGAGLSKASQRAMVTPAVRVKPWNNDVENAAEIEDNLAWGLGWGLETGRGGEPADIFWHWGDNGVFKAFVIGDIKTKRGLVYFTNGTEGLAIVEPMIAPLIAGKRWSTGYLGYERYDRKGRDQRLAAERLMAEGRYLAAAEQYQAAQKHYPDSDNLRRREGWARVLGKAEREPATIPGSLMAAYAGTYGPRKLTVEGDALHYQRGEGTKYRLIPASETLFLLDGLDWFRIEIARDDAGKPLKIVGHYLNGNRDESPRDPDQ